MKKIFLLVLIVLETVTLSAQRVKESDVPPTVIEAFGKAYPSIAVRNWYKEKRNYEAAFEMNNNKMFVTINKSGTISKTESEMSIRELPQSVREYCKEKFKGKKIRGAYKLANAEGATTYEVELVGFTGDPSTGGYTAYQDDATRGFVLFDGTGKYLRKVNLFGR